MRTAKDMEALLCLPFKHMNNFQHFYDLTAGVKLEDQSLDLISINCRFYL